MPLGPNVRVFQGPWARSWAEIKTRFYAGNLVSQGGSGTYGVGRIRRRGRVPDGLPDRSPEFAHRLVKLEKTTRPGERMGASTPSGLGARSGAPSQVPRHVAANGPAGPGPAPRGRTPNLRFEFLATFPGAILAAGSQRVPLYAPRPGWGEGVTFVARSRREVAHLPVGPDARVFLGPLD